MAERFGRLRLPVESRMPGFDGANAWLNSEPLTPEGLHGRVVAVDFWTYTCINWLRTLPYLRAWNSAYASAGLVIVGVHTPEFGVEHNLDNIHRQTRAMGVEYPVAVDNDYAIWDAFANEYWPALYIADAEGRIRHHHFGEGGYERSESVIRELLTDAGAVGLPDPVTVEPRGIEIPADWDNVRSPESYVGYARAEGFASPEDLAFDEPRAYTAPARLRLNEFSLAGDWTVGREDVVCNTSNGRLAFRFHARDLNLIITPPANGSAKFVVRFDGRPPGDARGVDVDEEGNGIADESRLYQLIRQHDRIADRDFEIEFLDPGAAALCFTFG